MMKLVGDHIRNLKFKPDSGLLLKMRFKMSSSSEHAA